MCLATQCVKRSTVNLLPVALAFERRAGRNEPEPGQILEQRGFELLPAAHPVVVLDAEDDAGTQDAGDFADVERVYDVAEVQVPCR